MSSLLDSLSVLILLSCFILMANKMSKSYIKTFRIQSLLIAVTAGIMGVKTFLAEGRVDVLVVFVLIVLLKVIWIPNILQNAYRKAEYRVEKDFIWNIPILVLVCCGLVVFSYFALANTEGLNDGFVNVRTVDSLAVILIGLFFMISRRKAIGQIIGFLVIENGLFTMAMFSTQGMPFIVDIGIFVDMLTAVMLMGIMVFKINEQFESINIDKLNKLKG